MPTYQYQCSGCGHNFEALQSMTEERLKKCPKCGQKKLDRLIGSGAGIIFKGSGFYETDYKKKTQAPCGAKPSECPKIDTNKKENPNPKKSSCGCPSSSCGCS